MKREFDLSVRFVFDYYLRFVVVVFRVAVTGSIDFKIFSDFMGIRLIYVELRYFLTSFLKLELRCRKY